MVGSKVFYVVALAFLLSISFASALHACSQSQTIMKIGALDNAHVETASSSLYSTRICYDDLFGVQYSPSSPQSCTGSNIVAKLSQATNAHIEGPAGTAFSVNVCYGDLVCALRSGACQLNEAQVLSIAQATNAHASAGSAFPYKICCSSAFAQNNGNVTNNTGTGRMTLAVNSPVAAGSYDSSVLIDVTARNATAVLYNFGGANYSYNSPVSVPLSDGSHTVNVYALNATTMISRSVSFSIFSTPVVPNSTGTGLMSSTVVSPVAGATYTDFLPINIVSANATSVLYNLGSGNITYSSQTTVSLPAGSYSISIYVSNSTTLFQQSISFNMLNSTTNSNGNNTNGSGNNGGSSGSGDDDGNSGSGNHGVKRGTTVVTQRDLNLQESGGDEPIILSGPETSTRKSIIGTTAFVQGFLILFIVLLLAIIIWILVNRRSQQNRRK